MFVERLRYGELVETSSTLRHKGAALQKKLFSMYFCGIQKLSCSTVTKCFSKYFQGTTVSQKTCSLDISLMTIVVKRMISYGHEKWFCSAYSQFHDPIWCTTLHCTTSVLERSANKFYLAPWVKHISLIIWLHLSYKKGAIIFLKTKRSLLFSLEKGVFFFV